MERGTVQQTVVMQRTWMPATIKLNRSRRWEMARCTCTWRWQSCKTSNYFQEHGGWGAVFLFLNLSGFQTILRTKLCCKQNNLYNLLTKTPAKAFARKAAVNKLQIQIRHQQSFVISSLNTYESIFRQTDVTFYLLVPAVLLLSLTTQPYRCFEVGNWRYRFPWILITLPIHKWPHPVNYSELFRGRHHVWKGFAAAPSCSITPLKKNFIHWWRKCWKWLLSCFVDTFFDNRDQLSPWWQIHCFIIKATELAVN